MYTCIFTHWISLRFLFSLKIIPVRALPCYSHQCHQCPHIVKSNSQCSALILVVWYATFDIVGHFLPHHILSSLGFQDTGFSEFSSDLFCNNFSIQFQVFSYYSDYLNFKLQDIQFLNLFSAIVTHLIILSNLLALIIICIMVMSQFLSLSGEPSLFLWTPNS